MAIIKLNPFRGSRNCFSTVRPTICPSLAYIAVSRCFHLLILPFVGWSWASLALRSGGWRGSYGGAQPRRFDNISQGSWFSLRINNWRSGPRWYSARHEAQSSCFSGVKCNPNPSCRVSLFDGNTVMNRTWSSHLTPAADHLLMIQKQFSRVYIHIKTFKVGMASVE